MSGKNNDIDDLVTELAYIGQHPEDDVALVRFADAHAFDAVRLLEELRCWREKEEERAQGARRLVVEGYSEESIRDAFSKALSKALKFMSELHDTSITVLGLVSLPRGGHRATLEVHITPMTLKHHAHREGLDVELKRIHDRDYRKRKAYEEAHAKALVHDHFLQTSGGTPDVPDVFMININDAELLNFMIEKDFFKAGHQPEKHEEPAPAIVQVRRPVEDMS